ncbi:MAG: glycosyltransferase [Akkermansiaceae bacterium]|nr:glycosyltransferase [Akkermansiaceae bacterium]
MGNLAQRLSAKAGGLADVSASLVNALYNQGADVHVALPNYRRIFHTDVADIFHGEIRDLARHLEDKRIHLAEDRVFYHRDSVYGSENNLIALAFQREVINNVIPNVRPDLIHCNDWMTGLIPAVARRRGIPCLFTVHNIHTEKMSLEHIEDRGIDAADFWQYLYYERPPHNYEESRSTNGVDLLTSGIFAADHVNTVSPTFLSEVVDGRHDFVPGHISHELWNKCQADCATGILNAPDQSFDPKSDPHLEFHFGPEDHVEGKRRNKRQLQEEFGLELAEDAPMLFWPSRLDPVQKGPQLLTDILHQLVTDYADLKLQIVIVANGDFQQPFHDIVAMHGIQHRVAVRDFNETLSRRGYAAADFMLMPSRFEPCGLPQMVSPKYGTLTVAHNTGGIHDTVEPLDLAAGSGNGFLFDHFDCQGFRWAIDEALRFYRQPAEVRKAHIARIMRESEARFNHASTAKDYIKRYNAMLGKSVTKGSAE